MNVIELIEKKGEFECPYCSLMNPGQKFEAHDGFEEFMDHMVGMHDWREGLTFHDASDRFGQMGYPIHELIVNLEELMKRKNNEENAFERI